MAKSKKTPTTPANQALPPAGRRAGAGRGGVVPPASTRFKPGQSGNSKGRPSAGATLREWLNQLAGQQLTESQLRKIARDTRAPWPKRAAARRVLRALEDPDVADMEDLTNGTVTLQELRSRGVNTSMIKKVKVRTRSYKEGEETVTEVEREVELHDRSGDDFDRIFDRTEGRPRQTMDLNHHDDDDKLRSPADGEVAADQLLNRLRERLGGAKPG